jgi:predicted solute-binding protein
MLRTGTADIGIVPVVAYPLIAGLRVIPNIAIGSRGPVRSILLISKVPLEEIRTVAADAASRTSVALLRVLLRKWFGGRRQIT